ncbi:MAG: formylglycine-generating enzyme family protein [Hyphomicrobium sp.]
MIPGSARPFSDCSESAGCPELVVVPANPAGLEIGSPDTEPGRVENEGRHARSFRSFAIGRTEVTVRAYRACVEAGACRPPEWDEVGGTHNIRTGTSLYYKNLGSSVTGDRQPVVGISHADASTYAGWLAKLTGHGYRLPSEAEWEYAARAGTSTAYWWGDTAAASDGSANANCRDCGPQPGSRPPMPVDSFKPNPWGLFNVHGNVWEWTADFYCENYASGPADGSARLVDDCAVKDAPGLRVFRGGSGFYEAAKMRAASRLRNYEDFRNFSVGFRVARDL